MIRDADLLDRLAAFPTEAFSGQVFRATRQSLNPIAASTSGGRWMPTGGASVLYTSLTRDGALAEISFHWAQLTPRPSKPAVIHLLNVVAGRTLRLIRADLATLGVSDASHSIVNYHRTQQIGDAVQFLEFDGLIAPSARWPCENLILFPENMGDGAMLTPAASESVDWFSWATEQGLLDD